MLKKLKFYQKRRRISVILAEHQHNLTFFIISGSVLLRMRKVSDKFAEQIKTPILCSITLFFENRVIYKIMWKNIKMDRPQMTLWRMRVARCIPKTTNTHSEYVIIIVFPLQQWLHEDTSVLRHTYICSLV